MKVDFSKIAELLLDANVMIDLKNSENMQVAELLSKELPCYIVEHTRAKVTGLSRELCFQIGIQVVDPDYDDFVIAKEIRGKVRQLAEDDALTLAVALRKGLTVISNDTRVVESGRSRGINVQREFFMLVLLVSKGVLSRDECMRIAKDIVDSNPWMSETILSALEIDLKNLI